MKAAPLQTSFNGGELSPYLTGRVDVAKYANGCERMVNFLPLVQGPAITRPGTWFVQEVKDSADRSWLIRFEFSVEDSYMLEFGDGYIRFYFNRAQVQVSGVTAWSNATAYEIGDLASRLGVNYYCIAAHTNQQPPNATYWYPLTGTIYEIPSPYTAAQLTNSDGTLAIRYVQTGDVIYLVHPDHPPHKLSRFGSTDWVLSEVDFSPPPFAAENTTTTTIYASATTGSVTLQASADIFTSAHVGQYIYLAEKDVRDTEQWEAAKSITAGDLRRSDGKNYEALNTATTGTVKPTHSIGAAYDGDGAVQWQFTDPGYGWVLVTGFTDANTVTATVVSQLPDGCVTVGKPTTRWAFQAWNDDDGYPDVVTFFRERLVFARRDTLWFSVSADFENFAYQVDGLVTADSGFDRTLSSGRVNTIRWLSPGEVLLAGTIGDEWAIVEATTTDPFGPDNCKTKPQSTYGSSRVAPIRAHSGETLFVQKSGRKVRAMESRFEDAGFESPDVSVFANHITKPSVIDMALQQEPWSIVWCARSDGVLVGLTFAREQEVIAWHRHPFLDGVVECVETIPSPDGTRDDLWLIVRYTIDGATKRYIAYLATEDDETGTTDQADWAYSEMMLKYEGAAADVISGLDHLEGEEVWVLADGARHPNRTVSGGAITLQLEASTVIVGKPCEGFVETMNLEAGAANGTAQGKVKRIHAVTVRVNRSLGVMVGSSDDLLEDLQYRLPSVPMGSAPPPYTGDVLAEFDADYNTRATVIVKKDRPMPITLVAVMPQLVTSEGR